MMRRILATAFVLITIAATAVALRHLREPGPPAAPRVVRASFSAPPGTFFAGGGEGLDAALSADGQEIVFAAVSDGVTQLWHRRMDAERAVALPGTVGGTLPAWKPGNRAIAFFADGELKQFSFGDGTVSVLGSAPSPAGVAWREDGSLVFVPDTRGPVKSMRNGIIDNATRLRSGDRGHLFPSIAGDALIYMAEREDGSRIIRYASPAGEADLTRTSGHGSLSDGHLVFIRDGVLLAQRFDREQRILAGRATVLAPAAGVSGTGHGFFAVGPDVVLSAPVGGGGRQIAWIDEDGRPTAVGEPRDYWQLRLSPDGRHIAVTGIDPLLRSLDVFVVPASKPIEGWRLSLSLGPDTDPVWMSDRVVYRTQQRGSSRLMSRRIAPQDAPELDVPGSSGGDVPSDARAGTLLVHARNPQTGLDIYAIADGDRRPIANGPFNEWDGRISPDGHWLAYVSDESGQPDVYVEAWPTGGRTVRVTFAGGRRPQWVNRRPALLFVRGDSIWSTAAEPQDNRLTFGTPVIRATARGLLDYALSGADRLLVLSAASEHQDAPAQMIVNWMTLVDPPPDR